MEPTFILASLIIFGAFLINAIGGFGSGIIAMPLLLLFLDLRLGSVAFALATMLSFLQLDWIMRRELDYKPALPFLGGSIVGLFIGISMLMIPALDIWAKAILTVIIILLSVKELAFQNKEHNNQSEKIRVRLPIALGLGTISGILSGWINMGGPPLIIYAYHNFKGRTARRFLIVIFTLSQVLKLIMYSFKNLYTTESLILFAYMAPAVLLGTILGHKFQKKIKQDLFVQVIWSIMLLLGVILGANTILSIT